jgi:hypothetical protein
MEKIRWIVAMQTRVGRVRGQVLDVVLGGELPLGLCDGELVELQLGMPAQVRPADQEQDPLRPGIPDQPAWTTATCNSSSPPSSTPRDDGHRTPDPAPAPARQAPPATRRGLTHSTRNTHSALPAATVGTGLLAPGRGVFMNSSRS